MVRHGRICVLGWSDTIVFVTLSSNRLYSCQDAPSKAQRQLERVSAPCTTIRSTHWRCSATRTTLCTAVTLPLATPLDFTVEYAPGTLTAVALNGAGVAVANYSISTRGEAVAVQLSIDAPAGAPIPSLHAFSRAMIMMTRQFCACR